MDASAYEHITCENTNQNKLGAHRKGFHVTSIVFGCIHDICHGASPDITSLENYTRSDLFRGQDEHLGVEQKVYINVVNSSNKLTG
jgi:hypothetical protein